MLKNNNTSLARTTTPITQEGLVIASGDAGQTDWRIFKPNIDDDGTTYELLRQALKLEQRDTLLRLSELASRSDPSAARTLRAKAASAILRDLLQIGWEFRLDAHWIYLRPPSDNGSSTRKRVKWDQQRLKEVVELIRSGRGEDPIEYRWTAS